MESPPISSNRSVKLSETNVDERLELSAKVGARKRHFAYHKWLLMLVRAAVPPQTVFETRVSSASCKNNAYVLSSPMEPAGRTRSITRPIVSAKRHGLCGVFAVPYTVISSLNVMLRRPNDARTWQEEHFALADLDIAELASRHAVHLVTLGRLVTLLLKVCAVDDLEQHLALDLVEPLFRLVQVVVFGSSQLSSRAHLSDIKRTVARVGTANDHDGEVAAVIPTDLGVSARNCSAMPSCLDFHKGSQAVVVHRRLELVAILRQPLVKIDRDFHLETIDARTKQSSTM